MPMDAPMARLPASAAVAQPPSSTLEESGQSSPPLPLPPPPQASSLADRSLSKSPSSRLIDNNNNNNDSTTTSSSQQRRQEAMVVKFSELLAKESSSHPRTGGGNNTNESSADLTCCAGNLKGLFSKDVREQDVVLVLPSLEIQLFEKQGGGGGNGALPGVGESHGTDSSTGGGGLGGSSTTTTTSTLPQQQRPTMIASVLTSAAKDAANAELEVAKSLEDNSSWTKSTVGFAPAALVNNLSQSFSRLVGSRMKAWTVLLLRHSLNTGDESSRKRLLGILAASLRVEYVSTKFTTIPLPDSAKGHEKEADVILPLLFGATVTVTGQGGKEKKDEPVILRAPGTISANFVNSTSGGGCAIKNVEIQLDCSVLLASMVEQARILVLKAVAAATRTNVPTTVATNPLQQQGGGGGGASSSYYHPGQLQHQPQPPFLNHNKGGGGTATTTAPPGGGGGGLPLHQNLALASTKPCLTTSKSLASFRSAMSLSSSSTSKSPQLRKAQCSAFRLNNILQGNQDEPSDGSSNNNDNNNKATLGLRKTRPLRWNTPGELPTFGYSTNNNNNTANSNNRSTDKIDTTDDQAMKKARSIHGHQHAAAKLKSFKSFGRPHAGDFGSGPRNATFGEFGGRSTTGSWGRDGRMASHPKPMHDATLRDPLSGEFHAADRNATFQTTSNSTTLLQQQQNQYASSASNNNAFKQRIHHHRPSIHLASGDGPSMPRTATVLESLLMKRSMT